MAPRSGLWHTAAKKKKGGVRHRLFRVFLNSLVAFFINQL